MDKLSPKHVQSSLFAEADAPSGYTFSITRARDALIVHFTNGRNGHCWRCELNESRDVLAANAQAMCDLYDQQNRERVQVPATSHRRTTRKKAA